MNDDELTRRQRRLLDADAAFQRELKALNVLQAYQRQRLYAKYKPRLDELALRVSVEDERNAP